MRTPYTLEQDAEYIAQMAKVWSKELEIIQATLAKSENIFESIKLKRVIKEINEAAVLLKKDRSNDRSPSTVSKM